MEQIPVRKIRVSKITRIALEISNSSKSKMGVNQWAPVLDRDGWRKSVQLLIL